ncbi:MAG: type IX secretion system membrane protein PorP/SprF [Lutibacter sp.]|nr:type IX secretion system membrane protein PorP/SprF [Lutibacter sp.]MBP9600700.1 type IX secretion system membrane protein PorP/SprF [Lutibacter sp.]
MKKIILHALLLLIPLFIRAQQDAQYTQYMYNMSIVNPAYTTGNLDAFSAGILHRSQWSGVVGAPRTSTLFLHAPITSTVETGLSIINDNIGNIVKENNIFGDFAYKLDLEENGFFSFGVKTGVTFFDVNFNNLNLESGEIFTDPNFTESINRTFFNFGFGMFYNTEHFYFGASLPNVLKSRHGSITKGKYRGTEEIHLFLTSGYVFEINDQLKLKPASMLKAVKGFPITVDATLNILYNNTVEFGVGYRFDDSFSGLINFAISPQLRIGYAYDHSISNIGEFNSGSHEILLLIDLITKKYTGYRKSPRFF